MSRKQVVLLTSAILMVILATTTVVWIQNAEADISVTTFDLVTHACVDTDHPSQSDVCQSVIYVEIETEPELHGHLCVMENTTSYKSTGVTSCNQCPNPPFTNYN